MSYQGPNVKVEQKFETTAPAVAVETLPSAVVAPAFSVYSKQKLGNSVGILDDVVYGWVKDNAADPVIFDDTYGKKLYERYPVVVYARDVFLGKDFEIEVEKDEDGIKVDLDESYVIFSVSSNCKAVMPYMAVSSGTISLDSSNQILSISNGTCKASGLVPGMEVVVLDTTYKLIGIISSVDSDYQITLAAPYSGTLTAPTAVYVGAGKYINSTSFNSIKNRPAYIYDNSVDFIRSGIRVGDFVSVQAPELSDTIEAASIDTILHNNLIRIFSGTATNVNQPDTNQLAYNLYDYYATDKTASSICNIDTYSISRFVGFTPKLDTETGGSITLETGSSGTTNMELSSAYTLHVGDKVAFEDELDKVYTVMFVVDSSNYRLDKIITASDGKKVYAWNMYDASARISNDIVASYRAARLDLVKNVYKSSDYQLIGTNGLYGDASVYNDLAFMISIISGLNGGRVLYAVSVDPTKSPIQEYSEALEKLKFYDVYSHVLGTNDAGVLALLPAYVNEQSDPYEGHERIAVLAYDEDDVYKLGQDTATFAANGIMTASTSGYMTSIGLSIGDKIRFTDDNDVEYTVTVTGAPSATTVQTDYDGDAITSGIPVVFMAGIKSKQAQKIAALGSISNHRCSIVWPGTFKADFAAVKNIAAGTGVQLPSYYLAAAIVGMDGGQKVSQSFTRLGFSIPGLSNIMLNTNYYFRRSELDIIGGGGIDILVQDAQISNVIYSRHDLTTDMSAVELRERSVTKQADQAAKTLRQVINPYIGKYNITDKLIQFIRMVLSAAKNALIRQGVIDKLEIVSVTRDPEIADKINVLVRVTVFIAGNYYDITMLVVSR